MNNNEFLIIKYKISSLNHAIYFSL